MNEQENLALIRKIYAAFEKGDLPTILDCIADNAEWVDHGPAAIPYAGSRSGKNQIVEFFQAIGESTADGRVTTDNLVAQGDTVLVTGRHTATVRKTGAKIDTRFAHVYTVRNGKVVKWEGFSDSARVAEAHTGKALSGR